MLINITLFYLLSKIHKFTNYHIPNQAKAFFKLFVIHMLIWELVVIKIILLLLYISLLKAKLQPKQGPPSLGEKSNYPSVIGNVKLIQKCFSKHLLMGNWKNKTRREEEKSEYWKKYGKHKKANHWPSNSLGPTTILLGSLLPEGVDVMA